VQYVVPYARFSSDVNRFFETQGRLGKHCPEMSVDRGVDFLKTLDLIRGVPTSLCVCTPFSSRLQFCLVAKSGSCP
jgi:hypothetical protein